MPVDPDVITAEEASLITDLDPIEPTSRPEFDRDDGTCSRAERGDLSLQLRLR